MCRLVGLLEELGLGTGLTIGAPEVGLLTGARTVGATESCCGLSKPEDPTGAPVESGIVRGGETG
jgi:hypothetical protein